MPQTLGKVEGDVTRASGPQSTRFTSSLIFGCDVLYVQAYSVGVPQIREEQEEKEMCSV